MDYWESPLLHLPLNEKAEELVELISMPELLETQTLRELQKMMARCRYTLARSGSVTMGWHGRTGAFLVTADGKGISMNIGPDGMYDIDVYIQDIARPTHEEIRSILQGHSHLPAFMNSFYRGKKFAAFERKIMEG